MSYSGLRNSAAKNPPYDARAEGAPSKRVDVRDAIDGQEHEFVGLGLVPEGASSLLMPRTAGYQRAFEMLVTGGFIDAATALDWGLVNRVVPAADLMTAARAFAEAQLGLGYDYRDVFSFLTRTRERDGAAWFCSELVAATCRAIGRPLLHATCDWEVPPSEIARSLALTHTGRLCPLA